jgi:hypothetical protein
LAEDRGAFKTNPADLCLISVFCDDADFGNWALAHAVAAMPQPQGNRASGDDRYIGDSQF